jgi:hypothetical protein
LQYPQIGKQNRRRVKKPAAFSFPKRPFGPTQHSHRGRRLRSGDLSFQVATPPPTVKQPIVASCSSSPFPSVQFRAKLRSLVHVARVFRGVSGSPEAFLKEQRSFGKAEPKRLEIGSRSPGTQFGVQKTSF